MKGAASDDLWSNPCKVVDIDVYDEVTAVNTNWTAGEDDESRTPGDTGHCILAWYSKSRSC